MKGKKVEILWNKISLTGCKLSSLNAPGSETPVNDPFLQHPGSREWRGALWSEDGE